MYLLPVITGAVTFVNILHHLGLHTGNDTVNQGHINALAHAGFLDVYTGWRKYRPPR